VKVGDCESAPAPLRWGAGIPFLGFRCLEPPGTHGCRARLLDGLLLVGSPEDAAHRVDLGLWSSCGRWSAWLGAAMLSSKAGSLEAAVGARPKMPKTDHDAGSSPSRKLPMVADEGVTKAHLDEMIAARKGEVGQRLEGVGVLRGLGLEQRERLIDLVVKLSAQYELWQTFPKSAKLLRIDKRDGAGQRRMFRTKIKKAIVAVEAALRYAGKVGGGARANRVFSRTLDNLAVPFLKRAREALEEIPLEWGNFTNPRSGADFKDPKLKARLL
jgi:hypothetical protein